MIPVPRRAVLAAGLAVPLARIPIPPEPDPVGDMQPYGWGDAVPAGPNGCVIVASEPGQDPGPPRTARMRVTVTAGRGAVDLARLRLAGRDDSPGAVLCGWEPAGTLRGGGSVDQVVTLAYSPGARSGAVSLRALWDGRIVACWQYCVPRRT